LVRGTRSNVRPTFGESKRPKKPSRLTKPERGYDRWGREGTGDADAAGGLSCRREDCRPSSDCQCLPRYVPYRVSVDNKKNEHRLCRTLSSGLVRETEGSIGLPLRDARKSEWGRHTTAVFTGRDRGINKLTQNSERSPKRAGQG